MIGSNGAYQLCNVEKKDMSLKQYINLCQSKKHSPPEAKSYDDLERNYWRSLNCFHPIYGADVSGTLTDPDQKIWNIKTLRNNLPLLFYSRTFT